MYRLKKKENHRQSPEFAEHKKKDRERAIYKKENTSSIGKKHRYYQESTTRNPNKQEKWRNRNLLRKLPIIFSTLLFYE